MIVQTLREYQRFNKGDATYVWLSNRIAGKKTPFVVDKMPKKRIPIADLSLLNGVYFGFLLIIGGGGIVLTLMGILPANTHIFWFVIVFVYYHSYWVWNHLGDYQ